MAEYVTSRQRKAIETLLTSGNISGAAGAAHTSRNMVCRWFKQDRFKQALAAAAGESMTAVVHRNDRDELNHRGVLEATPVTETQMGVRRRSMADGRAGPDS